MPIKHVTQAFSRLQKKVKDLQSRLQESSDIDESSQVELPTEKYQYDSSEGVVMPKTFDGAPIAPDWHFDQILPIITDHAVKYIHEQASGENPFFLYFSMTSPHEPVVPSAAFEGKSGIAPIADFVMETDWSAGQVIQALEDAGIADNTLLIFTADNGHSGYTGWDDLINAGHYPSGSFRGHKADIWEGGHRVPFIVRWPGHVTPGSYNDQLLCLNDVYATCAELLEKKIPVDAAVDSYSFLGTLLSKKEFNPRSSIVHHSVHGEFAYREGPWKLIYQMPTESRVTSRGKRTIARLYNLDVDEGETNDVAGMHPELVGEMTRALNQIIQNGRSTAGPALENDVSVDFRSIQPRRWMAEEN